MKQKTVVYLSLFIFILLGSGVGWFIHHHLKDLGVTFITIGDVVGCYALSIVLFFFAWAWIVSKINL